MKTSLIPKRGWLIVLCFCLSACVPWPYFYPSLAPGGEKSWSITASIEPVQGDGADRLGVCWQKGDKIKVFNADNPEGLVYELMDLDEGETTGRFLGDTLSGDGPFYAVFPASQAVGSLPELSLVIPPVQIYEPGALGRGARLAIAKGNSLSDLQFRSVGGLLKVTVKGYKTLKSVNLYATDGDFLQGTAGIDLDAEFPTLVIPPASESSSAVSLEVGDARLNMGGSPFYIFLPAESLSGRFQVETIDTEGKAMLHTEEAATSGRIERARIHPMPAFEYKPKYQESFLTSKDLASAGTGADQSNAWAPFVSFTRQSGQYMQQEEGDWKTAGMQDWRSRHAVLLTVPLDLSLNTSVEADVKVYGKVDGMDSGLASLQVVKQFGARTWLVDEASGNGYIIR